MHRGLCCPFFCFQEPLYKVESSGKEQGLSPAALGPHSSAFQPVLHALCSSVELLLQASQTSGAAQAPLHASLRAGAAKETLLPSGGTGHGNENRDLVLMRIWEGSPEDHGGRGHSGAGFAI